MKKVKICIIALLVSFIPVVSFAQADYNLGEVIITATKTEQRQAEIGSCTTAITADEIAKSGKTDVVDLLRTVPGVNVTQNAGLGSFSTLSLRGGAPGYTMVMIDGVEVKYPMEMGGGFYDFAFLSTDNIERIEIVRGAQSTLYGSSAMSGVINIITKQGNGKPKVNLALKGGSYNTFREAVDFGGAIGNTNFSLAASRVDSTGISIAPDGEEADGAAITNFSGSIGFDILKNSKLKIVSRYTDADTDLDDSSSSDDPNSTAKKRMLSSKIQFEQPLSEIWEQKLFVSLLDTKRDYSDITHPGSPSEEKTSWYKGGILKFEWQNNIIPTDNDTVTVGIDYQDSKGSTFYRSVSSHGAYESEVEEKIINNTGLYIQNQYSMNQRLFTSIGARIDNHQLFGSETTYKVSAAYLFSDAGTRLKANYGTGFRSPSIYQLYSGYGDEELKPEKTKSYDFGFDQSFIDNKVSFGLTYFNNDFANLIEYVGYPVSKYQNVAEAQTKGIEAEVRIIPVKNVVLSLNDTYLDTLNKETEEQLLKQPRNKVNAGINWLLFEKLNTNFSVSHTEGSMQYKPYPTIGTTSSYTKADMAVSYKYSDYVTVFGNIDNLFDKDYQEVYGYNRPKSSFYAGVKAGF